MNFIRRPWRIPVSYTHLDVYKRQGLLALVGDTAPTRAILCAGAGHFASAHVTLTDGLFVGRGEDAAARVVSEWDRITDRRGEVVPAYGFTQAERELANAGFTAPTMAVQR